MKLTCTYWHTVYLKYRVSIELLWAAEVICEVTITNQFPKKTQTNCFNPVITVVVRMLMCMCTCNTYKFEG